VLHPTNAAIPMKMIALRCPVFLATHHLVTTCSDPFSPRTPRALPRRGPFCHVPYWLCGRRNLFQWRNRSLEAATMLRRATSEESYMEKCRTRCAPGKTVSVTASRPFLDVVGGPSGDRHTPSGFVPAAAPGAGGQHGLWTRAAARV